MNPSYDKSRNDGYGRTDGLYTVTWTRALRALVCLIEFQLFVHFPLARDSQRYTQLLLFTHLISFMPSEHKNRARDWCSSLVQILRAAMVAASQYFQQALLGGQTGTDCSYMREDLHVLLLTSAMFYVALINTFKVR